MVKIKYLGLSIGIFGCLFKLTKLIKPTYLICVENLVLEAAMCKRIVRLRDGVIMEDKKVTQVRAEAHYNP